MATVLNMGNPILLFTKKNVILDLRREEGKEILCNLLHYTPERCNARGKKRSFGGLPGENVLGEHKNLTTHYLSDYNKRNLFFIPSK